MLLERMASALFVESVPMLIRLLLCACSPLETLRTIHLPFLVLEVANRLPVVLSVATAIAARMSLEVRTVLTPRQVVALFGKIQVPPLPMR